jgi:transcriptional regulator with XRE-family HTH domain
MPSTASVAARLRATRTRAGVTQRDLAARSGVSERQIRRLEHGECEFRVLTAVRLTRALGVTADYMITGR